MSSFCIIRHTVEDWVSHTIDLKAMHVFWFTKVSHTLGCLLWGNVIRKLFLLDSYVITASTISYTQHQPQGHSPIKTCL